MIRAEAAERGAFGGWRLQGWPRRAAARRRRAPAGRRLEGAGWAPPGRRLGAGWAPAGRKPAATKVSLGRGPPQGLGTVHATFAVTRSILRSSMVAAPNGRNATSRAQGLHACIGFAHDVMDAYAYAYA